MIRGFFALLFAAFLAAHQLQGHANNFATIYPIRPLGLIGFAYVRTYSSLSCWDLAPLVVPVSGGMMIIITFIVCWETH